MLRSKPLILFISFFYSICLRAQELPPVQNFTPADYHAENQNWGIAQSQDKRIYSANNEGLLAYNGANWTLYPSPNETIIRSVTVVGDKIYTGAYMEFGFWQRTALGELEYTSLTKQLEIQHIEDEEFWKIIAVDNYIVFQSLKRIYIYNTLDGSISTIDSKEEIVKLYKVEESIYFQRNTKGIFKIVNGKDVLFIDHQLFIDTEVVNLFSDGNAMILITRNKGVFSYQNGALKPWNIFLNDRLNDVRIYDAIQLKDKSLVLGTIANGLFKIDATGEIIYQINQRNGLLNNTVLSLFEDVDNNIWLALDNGISYINTNAPFKVYKDQEGILGSVYASAITDDTLYLGTNQGLFYKPLSNGGKFKPIKGTQGQVWSLNLIDEQLFCGHHKGTFLIEGAIAKKVSQVQGTWDVKKLDEAQDLLIQGNYDGLYVLKKNNNDWQERNKINGFNNSARHFEVLDSSILVNHEYKGIFKVDLDAQFTEVKDVSVDSTLKGANSSLATYNGDILYAYRKGILKYNKVQQRFIKDSILSTLYTEEDYISGKIIVNEAKDEFWVFSRNGLILVSPGELASTPKFRKIALTHQERNDVVEYENILSLNDQNEYAIGTSSGYIALRANKIAIKDFSVHIDKIFTGINKDHSAAKNLLDKTIKKSFKSSENNLKVSFYTPVYNKFQKPNYQFQLQGIYDDWSKWTSEPSVFFENLPPGDYTFNVRSKIANKVSSNMASYSFSIAKPWYISNVMIATYGLMVLLFSIFMHNVYKRYYKKEQQQLVEKNRRELELAKIQNEKEIIKIKNEKLKKDYKSKSKELAASTMSIVKKNELLAQVKEQLLTKVKDKSAVTPVVDLIDTSLNHKDNWEFFKEAFNNADSDFFKRLKELHPSLSPSDLKLCAYLRLNLSSKEIAPMFNISARSVEIKRYRLRKKLNLLSNENLTNYILSL